MNELIQLLHRVLEDYETYNPTFSFTCYGTEPSIKPYMHQIEFAARSMLRRPLRVLLADEIGLGKTITALITLMKLKRLGLAKRILIAVPRILIPQWTSELLKIGLNFRVIDRRSFRQLAEDGFQVGCYLASMDLIKRKNYIDILRKVPWDVVIIDEAHRLGKKRENETQRYSQIGEKLIKAYPERAVLLLSATPHRGDSDDYIARLILLDPYLDGGRQLDSVDFYTPTHNVVIFRRRKNDVNNIYERRRVFTDSRLKAVVVAPTKEESEFHRRLIEFLSRKLREFYEKAEKEPKELRLLLSLIFKRLSSSPYAAVKTMSRMIEKRAMMLESKHRPSKTDENYADVLADSLFGFGFEDYEEYYEDLEKDEILDPDEALNSYAEKYSYFLSDKDVGELKSLVDLSKSIEKHDSRLLAVKELIKHHVKEGSKVVLFTEYRDTANYLLKYLEEEFGRDRIVKLTGEEANDYETLRRVRINFEKRPDCYVLVATDVASEGLNLQVANILINYEPPWSPVKLEQRIGRVWRLGQKLDVTAYTIFLGVETDRDVLDILYKKFIALGRSIGIEKPLVGEEAIFIDMEAKEEIPMQISEFRKNGRKIRATEYVLRIEYLKGGRAALNELITYIIQNIERLRENLRRMNILPKTDRETVEGFLKHSCGFSSVDEAYTVLRELLKTLIEKAALELKLIYAPDGSISVISPGGAIVKIEDLNTAFTLTKTGLTKKLSLQSTGISKPIDVIAHGEDSTVYIYELSICEKRGEQLTTLYREPIGISLSKGEVKTLRGVDMIKTFIKTLEGKPILCDEYTTEDPYTLLKLEAKIKEEGSSIFSAQISELNKYRNRLEERGWRIKDPWFPIESKTFIDVKGPLAVITFTSERAFLKELEINPLLKKHVELKAMEYAMIYERENGREPQNVSQYEHFDILSRSKNGEVRYIEVKGHMGSLLTVELSEPEFKVAKEKSDGYWLYIVNGIGSGKPKLKAIRNPLNKMKIEVLESKKYRLSI